MIGAFDGNTPTPFAFLRSVGGPEPDAQVPDAERRLDITVFAATEKDANRISNRIHRYIRRGREEALQDGAITEVLRCRASSARVGRWTYWSGTSSCRECSAAIT